MLTQRERKRGGWGYVSIISLVKDNNSITHLKHTWHCSWHRGQRNFICLVFRSLSLFKKCITWPIWLWKSHKRIQNTHTILFHIGECNTQENNACACSKIKLFEGIQHISMVSPHLVHVCVYVCCLCTYVLFNYTELSAGLRRLQVSKRVFSSTGVCHSGVTACRSSLTHWWGDKLTMTSTTATNSR